MELVIFTEQLLELLNEAVVDGDGSRDGLISHGEGVGLKRSWRSKSRGCYREQREILGKEHCGDLTC